MVKNTNKHSTGHQQVSIFPEGVSLMRGIVGYGAALTNMFNLNYEMSNLLHSAVCKVEVV